MSVLTSRKSSAKEPAKPPRIIRYDSIGAESYAYFGEFLYVFVGDDRDVHVDGKYYVGYYDSDISGSVRAHKGIRDRE